MADDELGGTAVETQAAESVETTAPVETGQTPEATEPSPAQQDSFFDPKALSPELQGQWKKMQGAYTKRMQQASAWREKADLVDRFNSDPAIRRQILQQYQQEWQQAQSPQAPQQPQAPPAEFVQAFKSNLPAELQWMAESQAKSFWAANQMAMAPMMQQMHQQQQLIQNQQANSRSTEWDSLAEQLPAGWEEHEDEMSDLLEFLESPTMRHPVYGSKLQLLYQLATGQATATTQAIERMGQAAQQRLTTRGGAGQKVETNLTDRIMKSRSIRDAVQIAGQAALTQLEGQGARFE